MFSKAQEDLIIGSLLGDGHITNNDKPVFITSHAEDEKDYLYWKYHTLIDFCNQPPKKSGSTIKVFGDEEYLSQPSYRIHTRVQDALVKYREMSIIDIVSRLNETSLSIWMLDDGSRNRSNWTLSVPYKDDERRAIQDAMQDVFGLSCRLCSSDSRYLRFNAPSSRRIDELILSSIPNDLDIIRKKITGGNVATPRESPLYINHNGYDVELRVFCRDSKLDYEVAKGVYLSGVRESGDMLEYIYKSGGMQNG